MDIFNSCIYFLFWHALHVKWTRSELITSVTDLSTLYDTHKTLVDIFQNYIEFQEAQLNLMKQQLALHSKNHKIATNNSFPHLSNPINAFLLMRRLKYDKRKLEIFSKQNHHRDLMNQFNLLQRNMNFPTDADLVEAAKILLTLQIMFNLDTKSISQGKFNGVRSSAELSVDDCFELGQHSYIDENQQLSISWMKEALRKLDMNLNNTNVFRWEILEYLAFSFYKLGEISEAVRLTEELLSIFPEHRRATNNLKHYIDLMSDRTKNAMERKYENFKVEKENNNNEIRRKNYLPTQLNPKIYESLCQTETEIPIKIRSMLKCRYIHNGNPYLLIAPLKEEEASLNPRIILYREVIYEAEIEIIKTLAAPKLKPARVRGTKSIEGELSNSRISESTWLNFDENDVIATIYRRVHFMTSLNTHTAEQLHVANYGIGGYYVPHHDFFQKTRIRNDSVTPPGTDRIATVLFYLSDVELGGVTIFPHIHTGIWPEKGTAAFWYNLHSSGAADFRTLHGSCPIILGIKWIATIWIKEQGQMFLRPCDLMNVN